MLGWLLNLGFAVGVFVEPLAPASRTDIVAMESRIDIVAPENREDIVSPDGRSDG